MAKNLPQPNWGNFPAKAGDLTPKQVWQIVRLAIQYEAQESSDIEAPTWQGALWGAMCALFSDESLPPYNRHTVYKQQTNTAHTGATSALVAFFPEDGIPEMPAEDEEAA